MKEFLEKLYQAFTEAAPDFEDAGHKPIAFIDRYRGQPLEVEQHEYYELPALFISRQMAWEDNANGVASLEFHLITEPTWDTNNIAPAYMDGLKYYDFVDQVRQVLDGFQTQFNSALKRSIDRTVDTGVVIYEILGYNCMFYEGDVDADKYDYTGGDGEVAIEGQLKTKL